MVETVWEGECPFEGSGERDGIVVEKLDGGGIGTAGKLGKDNGRLLDFTSAAWISAVRRSSTFCLIVLDFLS